MIHYVSGDLFSSSAQTLVNTVNTVGVMGKGIALTFRKVFPDMFSEYQRLCESGELQIGRLHVWRFGTRAVLNFPTKRDWRLPSKVEYIEAGLHAFVESYREMGVVSIAFPPLGCGNGELSFDTQVQPLMERYLAPLPIPVTIFLPLARTDVPEHRKPAALRAWLEADPTGMGFEEVWRDLREVFASTRTVATLAQKSPLDVHYDSARDAMHVRAGQRTMVFERQAFLELWQELRHHRFLSARSAVAVDQRLASYVLPVFGALPYIEAVEFSDQYTGHLVDKQHAVRLRPLGSAAVQGELLAAG
jgi:O-acetyl-ADP-ribose deacetylase (regulator of RNase III)